MFDLNPILNRLATPGNFEIPMPEYFNFGFDIIDAHAAEHDKIAYIAVDRSGESIEHHSFSDLSKASNRFANVLRTIGATKGEFTLVILPRVPAWYEVMMGCIKAGVVSMPGTNLLTAKDIEYRVNKAGASIAIVSNEHTEKIEQIRQNCPTLQHLIVVGGERDDWIGYESTCAGASDVLDQSTVARSRSDEMMMAYFTSGTTSMPKMVPRDHSYALAHVITGAFWMDLKETDIHWTLSDTGWAKAAWGMLFPPWLRGATSILYDGNPKFDADAHLQLVEKLKVTTFCGPPTIYRLFAQMDLSKYDLNSLRHSFSAGEPLNPEVIKVWQAATNTTVHDGYGQTETVNIVANMPGMEVRPGSMGKSVPGVDVQIVDDQGHIVPDDEIGHIAVRVTDPHPPGLFHGYYEDENTLNRDSFCHGWYYTGDTATRDADGYIWFVGRSDDIISSASYRISPFEVESVLLEHDAVAESAVVGKPDELRGEIVKAYIVLASGFTPSEELKKEIQAYVKKTTAPYKYPREIEFRDHLPKTISGKIRRVELREEV
ncbi:MAG: AMP-binding protein [Gammaproteobacteria bacterium]|nr:AMP-binding protein [Gammaproteobacteria bacterium]